MKLSITSLAILALTLIPIPTEAKTGRPTQPPPPLSGPPPFCSVCSSVGFNVTNVLYTGSTGQGAVNVYGVAVGDFDNDGNPDWAAASPFGISPGRLWVHLGDGNGGFTPPNSWYDVARLPSAITAGDLDDDGNLDLLVTGDTTNTVSVLLGNGNGTFQNDVQYSTGGSNPRTLALADMDGDGNLDAVVSHRNTNNVTILFGNGAGALTPGTAVITGLPTDPREVVPQDFDNDGRTDLAVVIAGPVLIYLQDNTGAFAVAGFYSVDSFVDDLVDADFDRNGDFDLLTADGFDTVSIATGLGDGTFNNPVSFSAIGNYPEEAAIDDFDGDCDLDVAVAHGDTTPAFRLSVLLGDGAGNLGPQTHYNLGPLSNLTNSILTADFNQDGRPDVIAGNLNSYASVAINNCPCNPPPGPPGRLVITDAEFPLSVNGVYNLSTTQNGKPSYVSGDNNLWWTSANYWNLHDDNEQRFTHGDDTAFPPASGWLKMPQNSASEMKVLACP